MPYNKKWKTCGTTHAKKDEKRSATSASRARRCSQTFKEPHNSDHEKLTPAAGGRGQRPHLSASQPSTIEPLWPPGGRPNPNALRKPLLQHGQCIRPRQNCWHHPQRRPQTQSSHPQKQNRDVPCHLDLGIIPSSEPKTLPWNVASPRHALAQT